MLVTCTVDIMNHAESSNKRSDLNATRALFLTTCE